jgi:hypothetical protein
MFFEKNSVLCHWSYRRYMPAMVLKDWVTAYWGLFFLMFWDMADNRHTLKFDISLSIPPVTLNNKKYSSFRVQQYHITAYNIYINIQIKHLWLRFILLYFMEHSTSWKDRKISTVKILVYCVMEPWYVVGGYWRFGETFSFLLQIVIYKNTVVKIKNTDSTV